MDKNQPELTLEDSVKQVMKTLPPPIRDYLAQGRYTPVAKELMAKYGLRIDQGGILERGMMMLLMGIEDPNEFMQELTTDAKLDQAAVNGIMQDINTQIFMPLRDEMRKGAEAYQQSQQAPKPQAPATPAPAAATPPRGLPAGAKPLQAIVPQAPVQKPALRDVLASVMKAPPPAPAAPASPPSLSAPKAPSVSPAPQRAAPPENLPGAPREIHAPLSAPAPETRTEPPKPLASSAPAKPYSVDPYREPLDEK